MIAADAESILPLSAPRAFEGDFPVCLNSEWASNVVIRSSHAITGKSVSLRSRAQKALTLRTAGPREPSKESGRPTTIPRALRSIATLAMFEAS